MRVAHWPGFRFAPQTTPLSRRFRSAQAFTVEPGAVEAATKIFDHVAGSRKLCDQIARTLSRMAPARGDQASEKMTKNEIRNPNQVRMTKSDNAPAEKRPTMATPAESVFGRANESEAVT